MLIDRFLNECKENMFPRVSEKMIYSEQSGFIDFIDLDVSEVVWRTISWSSRGSHDLGDFGGGSGGVP